MRTDKYDTGSSSTQSYAAAPSYSTPSYSTPSFESQGNAANIGEAMGQVKAFLKKQATEAHHAALLEGISVNCMSACDGGGRNKLGWFARVIY